MFFWDSPIMQLLSSQNLTCTRPMCRAVPKQSMAAPGSKGTCTAPGTQQCSQQLPGVQGPRLTKCLLAVPLTTQSPKNSQSIFVCRSASPIESRQQWWNSGNAKTIRCLHLLWMQGMPEIDSPVMLCNSTAPGKAQPVAWRQTEKGLLPQGDPSSDLSSLHSSSAGNVPTESCSSILQELVWSKPSHLSSSLQESY